MKKKNIIILVILIVVMIGLFIGMYYFISNNGYISDFDKQMNQSNISEEAPNFRLKDLEGNDVSLTDYKGKKVFINIWATWCGPCRNEMPFIEEIYKEHPEIQILMVNSLEKKEDVQEYIQGNNFTFKVLLDTDEVVTKLYKAYAYPTSILINEKGVMVKKLSATMIKAQLLKFMGLE